jgi:hypothetical protein
MALSKQEKVKNNRAGTDAAAHSRQRPFFSPVIQPKLSINQPNDSFEQEADAMADKVMRMSDPSISPIQRKCHHCEEEEKKMQRKESSDAAAAAPPATENYINSLSGGRRLSQGEKSFFEPRMGYDFSNVQLHTDIAAAKSADSINALAYTTGNNIVFNQGQYAPDTDNGKKLLAHELTHVVQQNEGIKKKMIQRAENDSSVGCDPLTDTSPDINSYVNSALTSLRPATSAVQIDGIRNGIGSDSFRTPGRTQIEGWASSLPSTKAFQPAQSATKYAGVSYRLWSNPLFPILNPTMKVNGICIGSDKLGHFFQQGHEYYLAAHASGGSVATAIAGGQRQEATGYGLTTTGVYSNADLEANRKGLDFYNDLAASATLTFDINRYINANWSEVNNPNFYEASVGPVVWRNLLTGAWRGFMEDSTAQNSSVVTATLTVNPANNTALTGTFTHAGSVGIITGTVTHTSIAPPGPVATTAISGVTVNFDWTLGSDSGKGVWTNTRENELHGTWGSGASNNNRGQWDMSK